MKINVLQTIAGLKVESGGPSRTVTGLCNHLGRRGVGVTLISMDRRDELESCIAPDRDFVNRITVRGVEIPLLRAQYPIGFYKEICKLSRHNPQHILHDHGMWLPCNHAAASIARRLRLHYVVSPRGMLEPWALRYKAYKKKMAWHGWARRDLRTASAFCATAEKEAENIRAMGFLQPIAMIPNGVELPPWQDASLPNSGKRHQALFLSRVHPKKGVCELVDSWAQVRPPGWELIIAGPDEGGHARDVHRRIAKHGLESTVRMIGSVDGDAKWQLYRESDLFVLPTYSENFGVVVAEALATGTPVVTTKGAPWESLVQHDCGWWIDIGETPLVRALNEATALNDEARREMGIRGRRFVEKNFSWENIARKTQQFYLWLLGNADRPDFVIGAGE